MPQTDIEKTPGLGTSHVFAGETVKRREPEKSLVQNLDGVPAAA